MYLSFADMFQVGMLVVKFLFQSVVSSGYASIRESPPQFENRIMARVYVMHITRNTMYQKLHLLAGTGVWKIRSVACGFSSIKIDYSDYLRSLISRINEVYVFSIKYRYSDILMKKHKLQFKPFVLLKSHLLLC